MVVGAAVAVGSASDVVFASAVVVVVVVVVLTVVVVVALRGFAEEDTALTLTRTYVSDCDVSVYGVVVAAAVAGAAAS